jgi:hypothetical protein
VADVLESLMRKAAKKNKIRGIMTQLIEEEITHIQYAYDTILMIEEDDNSIVNMNFILYCFEWTSDLKINYHKSEAFMFGMDEERQTRIHVSNKKLGKVAFLGMIEKISKRIPHRKGKLMSSGQD